MKDNKLSFRLQLARCNVWRAIGEFCFGKPKTTSPQRIIVGGSTLLGDLVMMAPLIAALQSEFPESKIDILVPKGWASFAQHIHHVDQALESQLNNGDWFKAFRRQYHKRWDLAVIPFAYSLIPFFYAIGAKQLRSFPDPKGRRAYQIHQRVNVPQQAAHMSRMMLQLSKCPLAELQAPHFEKAPDALPDFLRNKRYVILHPGASHEPRFWPAQNYADIATNIQERGFEIVLTGGPGEEKLTNPIENLLRFKVFNLAGKTSLEALLAITAHAKLVLGPDTGIMHLARAVNVPSVTLMGQTQELVYGIDPGLHDATHSKTLYIDDLPCRDFTMAFKYQIPGIQNCRRHHCLFETVKCLSPISSKQVLAAIDEVLA